MGDASDKSEPGMSSVPEPAAGDASGRARAQDVLEELDHRYEPGWWRLAFLLG